MGTKTELVQALIERVNDDCIHILELYISGEEAHRISPSIKIANDGLKPTEMFGKIPLN